MYIFGKTKNFSFFLTENLKKSNFLSLLNFVRMNQLKLVWLSKKMLTNDLIIVTIDSSKITFITYK